MHLRWNDKVNKNGHIGVKIAVFFYQAIHYQLSFDIA